ncbi:MAG: peroxiredoxin family protein [Prevotella sp.]
MKRLMTLAFAAMCLSVNAQITVKVKNSTFPDGTKMLLVFDRMIADSASVDKGKCEFSLPKVDEACTVTLYNRESKWMRTLWVDKDGTSVYDMKKDKVKGSTEETIAQQLKEAIAPYEGKTSEDSLRMCDEAVSALADKYPCSYALMHFIYENRMFKRAQWSFSRYSLLERLDTASFKGKIWEMVKHMYNYDLAKRPGQPLRGNVYGKDVYGSDISLDDERYRGKYVLLCFSGVNCVDHKESANERMKVYNELKDLGYEELDFLHDNDVKTVVRLCAQYPGMDWQMIVGGDNTENVLRSLYVGQLPYYVFVSPERKVIATSDMFDIGKYGVRFEDIKPIIYKTIKNKKQ